MKFWRFLALVELLVIVSVGALYFHKKGEADEAWANYWRERGLKEIQAQAYENGRADYERQLEELRGMVTSAATVISEKEEAIAGKEADIEDLKRQRLLLSAKDDIITNQDEQLSAYEGVVFTLKEKDAERAKVVFSLTAQVQLQGQRLVEADAQIQAEKESRLEAERGWSLERLQSQSLHKRERLWRSVVVGSLSGAFVSQTKGSSFGLSLGTSALVTIITYVLWK